MLALRRAPDARSLSAVFDGRLEWLLMSLHEGALLARGDLRARLPRLAQQAGHVLGEIPSARAVRFGDVPYAQNQCVLGLVDGWTLLWNSSTLLTPPLDYIVRAPNPRLYDRADHLAGPLAELSAGTELYFSISEGTAGVYGVDWYVDGARRRSLWAVEKAIVHDEGIAFADEPEFRRRLEVSEWAMIELLGTLTVPYRRVEQASVDVHSLTWSVVAPPRPWWKLW